MRVYYDRLVDDTDKSWLYGYLSEVTPEHLGVDFNTLFSHLDFDKDGKVDYSYHKTTCFFDYDAITTFIYCKANH